MSILSLIWDATFTQDGDIVFESGDIKIRSGIELLKQKIYILLTSEQGTWPLFPRIGASLSKFNGYRNTRETAEEIKRYIIGGVGPYILPYVVTVEIVPIDYDTIKCYIFINGLDLPTSELMIFELNYQNTFTYKDFDPNVDTIVYDNSTTSDVSTPNKFANRLRNQ